MKPAPDIIAEPVSVITKMIQEQINLFFKNLTDIYILKHDDEQHYR